MSTKGFEYSVSPNYMKNYEVEEYAIYLSVDFGDNGHTFGAIDPSEAREFAAALIEQADAFDERQEARQEAKKYPTEDGWYLIFAPNGYWVPVRKSGDYWYNSHNDEFAWYFSSGVKASIDGHGYKKMTVED